MKEFHESRRVVSPTYHFTVIFSICVFITILVLSYVFKIEIVAQGVGKVVPTGRVQIVQPEFGGQIAEIRVRDGILVVKGDVLLTLDPTNAQAEVNTLKDEMSRLEVELLRINTLTTWIQDASSISASAIPAIVAEFRKSSGLNDVEFLEDQEQLLRAELEELSDGLQRIDARIQANRKSEAISKANIVRVEAALQTQEERFGIAQSLFEKGSTSRTSYLDVVDALTRLKNEKEIYLTELEQKSALELTYHTEKAGIISSQRSRVFARKVEIKGALHELRERLTTSKRWLANSELRAPVSGIVDRLSVFTVGGIVSAGQELMRIVPSDQRFEIEAVFPNRDVGFMEEWQTANVKLEAFPSERFGYVVGTVINVSADAVEIAPETFGFNVRIAPETPYLETSSNSYALRPGMTTTVDVITGKRRLISFFFAPIVKVLQESLGER